MVRDLADDFDVVAPAGQPIREGMPAQRSRRQLGREVLADDEDPHGSRSYPPSRLGACEDATVTAERSTAKADIGAALAAMPSFGVLALVGLLVLGLLAADRAVGDVFIFENPT